MGLRGLLRAQIYFLYVDDIRTAQETHLGNSTACYGDRFIYLNVENIRTSQEIYLRFRRPVTGIVYLGEIKIFRVFK
jgi:hypothetical protein